MRKIISIFILLFIHTTLCLYSREYTASDDDNIVGIAVDPVTGEQYAVGQARGPMPNSNTNINQNINVLSMFISKFNSSGVIWTQQIVAGGTLIPVAPVAYNGRVYYAARANENISPWGQQGIVTLAYDANSTMRWISFSDGGNIDEKPNQIALDWQRNRVWVAGDTSGQQAPPAANFGLYDMVLNAIDTETGQKIIAIQNGTSAQDRGNCVAVHPQTGNVIFGGETRGSMFASNAGGDDIVLIGYDSNGNLQWGHQFGLANLDSPVVATTIGDYFYVASYVRGEFSPDEGTTNQYDPLLTRLHINGTIIRHHQYVIEGVNSRPYALAANGTTSLIMVGEVLNSPTDKFILDVDLDTMNRRQTHIMKGKLKNLADANTMRAVAVNLHTNKILTGGSTPIPNQDNHNGIVDVFQRGTNMNASSPESVIFQGMAALEPVDIAIDAHDNIYMFGSVLRSIVGAKTSGSVASTTDFFLLKLDRLGNQIWAHKIDGLRADQVSPNGKAGIGVDSDSIYVTGEVDITVERNIVIFKFFQNGTQDWKIIRGNNTEPDNGLFAVASNTSDILYVGGETQGTLDGQTGGSTAKSSVFISRFDKRGNLVWTRKGPDTTTNSQQIQGMTIDKDNNPIYCGKDQISNHYDAGLYKLNTSGHHQWTRKWDLGFNQNDNTGGVAMHPNGVDIFVSLTLSNQNNDEVSVVFINGITGADIWQTTPIRSPSVDLGENTIVGPDAIYVAVTTQGDFNGATNKGADDVIVVRYNLTSGAFLSQQQFATNTRQDARALAKDSRNNVYLLIDARYKSLINGYSTSQHYAFLSRILDGCSPGQSYDAGATNMLQLPNFPISKDSCSDCPVGTYSTQWGVAQCTPCTAGSWTTGTGKTTCDATIPVLSSIVPNLVNAAGGGNIKVNGIILSTGQRLKITRGATVTYTAPCTAISSIQLNCTVPPLDLGGQPNATFAVQLDIVESTNTLTIEGATVLFHTFYPNSGPLFGSTNVIMESDFVPLTMRSSSLCQWTQGTTTLRRGAVSSNEFNTSRAVCQTPPFPSPGIWKFAYSANGKTYVPVTYTNDFLVVNASSPITMYPNHALRSGGATIQFNTTATQIWTSGFNPSVRFGAGVVPTYVVPASFCQQGLPTCLRVVVPDYSANSGLTSVNMRLSLNGQQYPLVVSGSLQLYSDHGLSAVTPTAVPLGGTNIVLDLAPNGGQSFVDTGSEVRVRIGQQTLQGQRLSVSVVQSTIPVVVGTAGTQIGVSLALNGQQYTPQRIIQIFDATSISVRSGPATGGTVVTVYGVGFQNTGSDIRCRFGNLGEQSGQYLSPTAIGCTSPTSLVASTSYDVQVTTNSRDYTTVKPSMTFQAYNPPTITTLAPIFIIQGNSGNITITGTGFIDTGVIVVMFDSIAVPGKFVSSTVITAAIPTTGTGTAQVTVLLNGVDASNALEFLFAISVFQCPSNTKPIGETATRREDCVCLGGFYAKGDTCEACMDGAVCEGGGKAPYPKPGFFSTGTPTQPAFTKCAVKASCQGGNSSSCGTGYQGRLCANCQQGYFKLGDNCQPCDPSGSQATIVVIVLLFVAYLFFARYQARSATQSAGKVGALIITHLQVISTFNEYRMEWPPLVKTSLSVFSFSNFNLETTAPECTLSNEWTFETKFWVTMVMPIVLVLGLLLRVLLEFARGHWVRSHSESFKRAHPRFCADPSLSSNQFWFILGKMRYGLSTFFTQHADSESDTLRLLLNEVMFTLGFVYIAIATRILQVFDCTTVREGLVVMDVNPNEECWKATGMHARLVIPGLVFLGLYIIGIPLLFLAVMYYGRERKVRERHSFQLQFSSLFNKYRGRMFWFESVILLRKVLVVAVQLFATTIPALQGLLGIVVIGGGTIMQFANQPYRTKRQNTLESILMILSLLMIVMGLVFLTGSDKQNITWVWATVGFLVAVGVVCVGYLISELMQSIQRERVMRETSLEEPLMRSVMGNLKQIVQYEQLYPMSKLLNEKLTSKELKDMDRSLNLVEQEQDEEKLRLERLANIVLDTGDRELMGKVLVTVIQNPNGPLAQMFEMAGRDGARKRGGEDILEMNQL